jgi:hypothetical protein
LKNYKNLSTQRDEFLAKWDYESEKLKGSRFTLEKDQSELTKLKTRLANTKRELQAKIANTKKAQEEELSQLLFDQEKELLQKGEEINSLDNQCSEHQPEFHNKVVTEDRRRFLTGALDQEAKDLRRDLADKEKEKVIETHELNLNITKKIEETKLALQELKKEQLETTRR